MCDSNYIYSLDASNMAITNIPLQPYQLYCGNQANGTIEVELTLRTEQMDFWYSSLKNFPQNRNVRVVP